MENMKMELQLTLQNACFILIAKSLWNQEDTKNKIENFFQSQLLQRKDWFHVEDYVLSKVSEIGFLGALRRELELVIILLGNKIRCWLEYVVEILNLDISYAMNISWTAHGTINKLHISFPLENIGTAKPDNVERAAVEMEAERCSYMLWNKVMQQKNALCFIDKIYNFHCLIRRCFFLIELNYFETALILAINKLSENEMELFLKKYPADIIEFYLMNYGFQKLFNLIFLNVNKFLTVDSYCDLIIRICRREFFLASGKSAAIDVRQNFVKSTFLLLWTEIPLEIKKKLILGSRLWEDLMRCRDTVIWKLIYNDKNLECNKNEMHSNLKDALCSIIYLQSTDFLPESNFDPKKVENLYIFEDILSEGDFYSAELLACILGVEIINVKLQLDDSKICNDLAETCQWSYIDQYLKWRFDSEQEAKIIKNRFRTNDFISEVMRKIWNELDRVTAFLFWLFESEENIVRYKMENPEIAGQVLGSKIFWYNPESKELFPDYEAFMKYWLLSSEYKAYIKENIIKIHGLNA